MVVPFSFITHVKMSLFRISVILNFFFLDCRLSSRSCSIPCLHTLFIVHRCPTICISRSVLSLSLRVCLYRFVVSGHLSESCNICLVFFLSFFFFLFLCHIFLLFVALHTATLLQSLQLGVVVDEMDFRAACDPDHLGIVVWDKFLRAITVHSLPARKLS